MLAALPMPLDRRRVDALGADLQSPRIAHQFLQRFVDMLPIRLYRIREALEREDSEPALTAILSLHASAAMIGARQLENDTRQMIDGLRRGHFARARSISQDLQPHAHALAAEAAQLLFSSCEDPIPPIETDPLPGPICPLIGQSPVGLCRTVSSQ